MSTRLILPANGRELPPAPHVEGTAEIHIVHPDGRCEFTAADGTRCCTEDHRPVPPVLDALDLFGPDGGFAPEKP